MRDKRRFQNRQITGYRRAADLARTRIARGLKDPPAVGQQQLDEFLKRVTAFQAEQLLDVLGPVGVHPLLEIGLRQRLGQKKGRQPAAQESMGQRGTAERRKIRQNHGRQPQLGLAPGQCIPEFSRGAQRGRAGGRDANIFIMIRRDLEQLRRIPEAMDFIQHNPLPPQIVQKGLGILHHPSRARQFTIKIFDLGQAPAQGRLADPPHPGKPEHGASAPGLFDLFEPERSDLHADSLA